MIPESEWQWYGNASHFICGESCRFHLATLVGDVVVSTVGEYWLDRELRRLIGPKREFSSDAKGDKYDDEWMSRFGFENIGYNRKYETMVFRKIGECDGEGCNCGAPTIDPAELDFAGYNDARSAREGHMELCRKWAAKELEVPT